MRRSLCLCFGLGYDLIHTRRLSFFSSVLDFQHSDGHRLVAEGNCDPVAYLNVVRRLCALAVNRYTLGVTSLVGYGTPFDKSGYLQEFVKTHLN